MQAVEILARDHATVLLVVKAATERLEAPEADPAMFESYAGDLIGFFRHASSCHDPKEDLLLTALLHRRAAAWDVHPVRDLVREREEMRLMLESAADWLALARAGDAAAAQPLLYDLRLYLALLHQHIAEEEGLLFPLAVEWLSADDLGELARAFETPAGDEIYAALRHRHPDIARSPATPRRAAPPQPQA